jgi:hypothetical protein
MEIFELKRPLSTNTHKLLNKMLGIHKRKHNDRSGVTRNKSEIGKILRVVWMRVRVRV